MFWFYQLFSGHSCLLHHQPPFIEKIIETPSKPLLLLMLLSWILLNNLATLEVLHFFSVIGDWMLFRAAWKDTFDLRKNYFLMCVLSSLWTVSCGFASVARFINYFKMAASVIKRKFEDNFRLVRIFLRIMRCNK